MIFPLTSTSKRMAVKPKPTNITSRLSPFKLREIYNSQLHKNQIPKSIWPRKPQPNPNPNIPILTNISNPQVLTQFLTSGLHHDPYHAGRAVKTLSFSSPSLAVSLFSLLPNPDAFISNTIIKSFLSVSQPNSALLFYRRSVIPSSISPNNFTFPLLAKLFAHLDKDREGRMVHTQIVKLGFEADVFVRNSLIHMYSCFADMGAAWKVFDGGSGSDLVTWNSMVDGLVKNGTVGPARELFDGMDERDLISWNVMIAGHMGVGEIDEAKDLFLRMPERDVVSWNSMLDGYAKGGEVSLAREMFDSMPERNVVSWNVMLAMWARVKDYRECLRLFDAMMAMEAKPNDATFVSVLTACASLGELERGKWVHSLVKAVVQEPDVLLSTALLTMYAKCGAMESAREIFDWMTERNIVSWNSMIVGYGLHGFGEKAVELFLEMERVGPRPNETTFVCILSGCAHGGMVVEGWWCFDRMVRVYGIEPKVEHFGCMVDLLGRVGLLEDSEELAKAMKGERSKSLLGALMSASRAHSNLRLGEIVGRKMIEMEPGEVGPYVLLSNIYAAEGRWDDVERVREKMKENGLKKEVGISLVGERGYGLESFNSSMEESSVEKKRMVYSMLTEMGTHLKLPYKHDCQQSRCMNG